MQLVGTVGLFTGYISDESYVALTSLVLGIYSTARTLQKRWRYEGYNRW